MMSPFVLGILMAFMGIAVLGEVAYTVAIWMREREEIRLEHMEEARRARKRYFRNMMRTATIE